MVPKWAKQYPCPVGTFGNVTKLMEEAQCTQCTKGYYCHKAGITVPTDQCHAGYYCVEGASVPTPNDTLTGAPCPPGSYCLQGSHKPQPCPIGTYGPNPETSKPIRAAWIAMEESFVILRAWLLPMARVTLDSSVRFALSDLILLTLLKAVAFVPQDTTVPERQPLHSNVHLAHLTMRTHATQPSNCIPCTPGEYCEGYGNTYPDGPCDEGWYCSRGAYSKKPLLNVNTTFNNSNDFTCPIYSVNFTGRYLPCWALLSPRFFRTKELPQRHVLWPDRTCKSRRKLFSWILLQWR